MKRNSSRSLKDRPVALFLIIVVANILGSSTAFGVPMFLGRDAPVHFVPGITSTGANVHFALNNAYSAANTEGDTSCNSTQCAASVVTTNPGGGWHSGDNPVNGATAVMSASTTFGYFNIFQNGSQTIDIAAQSILTEAPTAVYHSEGILTSDSRQHSRMHGDGAAPLRFSAGDVFWGVQYTVRLEDFDGTFNGKSSADIQLGYNQNTIIEDIDINDWIETSGDLTWSGFYSDMTSSGALDWQSFFSLTRTNTNTGSANLLWDYTIYASSEAFGENDISNLPGPAPVLLVGFGLLLIRLCRQSAATTNSA